MQQNDALPIRTPGVCVHAVVRWKSSSRCVYERRDRIIAEDDGRLQPKRRHTSSLDIPVGPEISNVARVVLPFRQHHMHGLARVFAETVTRSSAHRSRVRDGHDDLQRVEGDGRWAPQTRKEPTLLKHVSAVGEQIPPILSNAVAFFHRCARYARATVEEPGSARRHHLRSRKQRAARGVLDCLRGRHSHRSRA